MPEGGDPRPLEEMHEKQRHAFKRYLNMGYARSLRRLHVLLVAELGADAPGERTLMGWSATFGWHDAAKQHDRDEAAVDLAVTREQTNELRARKRGYGRTLQRIALTALADKNPTEISDTQLRLLLKDGVKLEEESIARPRTVDLTPDLEEMAGALGMDPSEVREFAEESLRDYQAAKDRFRNEFGVEPDD